MKTKKILLLIILLCFSSDVFAYGDTSLFDSNNGIKVISSEHFNIIYNDRSSLLANKIYENCEYIFSDICDYFNFSSDHNFNVVVTADIQQFNSFFAPFPNKIVIYDTVAANNYFNYFNDNLMLNVFKHELTHAISLTDNNKFITNTFGKLFSPANIFLTLFQKEGISVNSESSEGQGRLNDSSYLALLYEAKAEEVFPSYFDVQGKRDIPSNGNYYLFGSCFFQYLIKTYGVEKFNEYWEINSNWNLFLFFPDYSFKKAYHISIKQAWNDFKNSIKTLLIDKSIEIKHIENIYPKYIVGSGKNIFIGDYFQNNTVKIDSDNLKMSLASTSLATLGEVTSNKDILVLSEYDDSAQPITYTKVVSPKISKNYNIRSFRLAIQLNSTTLVGIKNEGEIEYLQWIDAKTLRILKTFNLKDNEAIQNMALNSSNDLVYTSRIGESNYLSILTGNERIMYNFGNGVSIYGLNIYKDKAILTTTRKGELGRLTLIDLATGCMEYMNSNILGGVYSPTFLDENTVLFISKYYNRSKLSLLNINDIKFNTRYLEKSFSGNSNKKETTIDIKEAKKYNALDFIFDDKIFIPYFAVNYLNNEFDYITTGLSYSIADPLQIYNIVFNPILFYFEDYQYLSFNTVLTKKLSNNTITVNPYIRRYFNTSANNEYIFNLKLTNSYTFDLRNHDTLTISSMLDYTNTNSGNLYSDESNTVKNENQNKIGTSLFSYYNYQRKAGKNPLSIFAYKFFMGMSFYKYDKYFYKNTEFRDYYAFDIGTQIEVNIPYLISKFDSYYSSSTATNLSCNLLYQTNTKNLFFFGELKSVLYSREIQKGYNFIIPFYFNRVVFLSGVNVLGVSEINSGGAITLDSSEIFLKAYLTNSLDTTSMFSEPFNIGISLCYQLIGNINPKVEFLLTL